MNKNENEVLKEEIDSLKIEIADLRENLNLERELLDSNVEKLYKKMKRKSNYIWVYASVISSCALWIIFGYLIYKKYDDAYIITCMIFLSISMVIMVVNVMEMLLYLVVDFINYLNKKKEIKDYKRKNTK